MIHTLPHPSDVELFRFVSEFLGKSRPAEDPDGLLPDWMGSLDAFAEYVWPVIVQRHLAYGWAHELESCVSCDHPTLYNASARDRCRALWHACRGVVRPEAIDNAGTQG